ncbi:MarR family transcriptional regulator [Glycomyces sp. A-F 0318]|uniref:MarR family winged helix-turn-helix transcriptional regulator n=1 Tax=Glycomyces amatae TaxID=2881355 RepID=UPI001E424622|nr:MarR family transcriptional regulator [Glycomyces amatae]MCD0442970.1 MarR family transcriptional regulator [Glycomyces amatae]
MEYDAVAHMAEQWRRERPDLDPSPMLVVGRMFRLVNEWDRRLRGPFAEAGLGNGDFDVLAALRRSGEPYALSAGELSRTVLVTTGAITKRVDRLEAGGWAVRSVDEEDSRGRRIALTEAGMRLVDELMAVHLEHQARLIGRLDGDERGELARLLAKLAEDAV